MCHVGPTDYRANKVRLVGIFPIDHNGEVLLRKKIINSGAGQMTDRAVFIACSKQDVKITCKALWV